MRHVEKSFLLYLTGVVITESLEKHNTRIGFTHPRHSEEEDILVDALGSMAAVAFDFLHPLLGHSCFLRN